MIIDLSEEELIIIETLVRKNMGFRQDITFENLLSKIQRSINNNKRQFNKTEWKVK